MKQKQVVDARQSEWAHFERLLDAADGRDDSRRSDPGTSAAPGSSVLPVLYRRVCRHYALARGRRYSPALVRRLEQLVWRGHALLYRRRGSKPRQLLSFLVTGFPRALRRGRRYVFWSAALFFLPAFAMGVLCFVEPDIIYSVMSPDSVAEMESMYDPDNTRIGRTEGRQSESDFVMFGFYIYNNIGIGFRTFASGILLGIGTVFLLLFNGTVIGGVAGHLSRLGYTDTFWPFVSGHSALELTAIVVCGAAGLMLAHGLVAPGRLARLDALRRRALQAVPLVTGAALMLLMAAFVEAFWSASGAAAAVKLWTGSALWIAVLAYFLFAGRRHGP